MAWKGNEKQQLPPNGRYYLGMYPKWPSKAKKNAENSVSTPKIQPPLSRMQITCDTDWAKLL